MKWNHLVVAAAVSLATALSALAESSVTELDARPDDSESGMYLMFVSKPVQEGSPMGDGFFVIGKGDSADAVEMEAAYGMHLDRGRPTLAAVSQEHVAGILASDSGTPVTITAVKVNGEQYAALVELIDRWSQIEKHDILPINAALDATQEAISIVGFKRPYRSGLGVPDLMLYFSDISLVNRKRTEPGAS